MSNDRPSPFTIPQPTVFFAEGPPSEPAASHSMTVEMLIRNLTDFAEFYEEATAEINRAGLFEKRYYHGGRDANADYEQRRFQATIGIDRVRAYVLSHFGEELTIGTARRFLGDLIRVHRLSVEAAQGLLLEAAMDLMDKANNPPAKSSEDEKPQVAGAAVSAPAGGGNRGSKRKVSQAEAEILVRDWLAANAGQDPAAVTRDAVAEAIGAGQGTVSKTVAWRVFSARRDADAKDGVREVPLTDSMLAVIPADCEAPDELAELIEEQKADAAQDQARHKRRHEPS